MSREPFIWTATGRRFYPLAPRVEDVEIEDIAHALANQCRFSGHTRTFYSVAEHSVRVSDLLAYWGSTPEMQLWGLLHDASEAYLVDVPSPLKASPMFEAYRKAEANAQRTICARYGLRLDEPAGVKVADLTMLATEIRDVMPENMDPWSDLAATPPLSWRIKPWERGFARQRFLQRFRELTS